MNILVTVFLGIFIHSYIDTSVLLFMNIFLKMSNFSVEESLPFFYKREKEGSFNHI